MAFLKNKSARVHHFPGPGTNVPVMCAPTTTVEVDDKHLKKVGIKSLIDAGEVEVVKGKAATEVGLDKDALKKVEGDEDVKK